MTGATWPGLVPQVTCGAMSAASNTSDLSYLAPGSVGSLPPARDGLVEVGAAGGERPAAEIVEGRLVRGDHAGAGAGFDRHVADGHPLFHRQAADRLARVLDAVAGAAVGGDLADEVQDQVLGRDAAAELAVDAQLQRLGLRLQQRLRGQHVLDFAGADAEGQRAERAVRGGVAVAADDRHARLRVAQLGADDVDDALLRTSSRS